MLTIKKVELIGKKRFVAVALDLENGAFIIHITSIVSTSLDPVHLFRKIKMASQKADKAAIIILSKFVDFANIFSSDQVADLLEYIVINNHTIKLLDDK